MGCRWLEADISNYVGQHIVAYNTVLLPFPAIRTTFWQSWHKARARFSFRTSQDGISRTLHGKNLDFIGCLDGWPITETSTLELVEERRITRALRVSHNLLTY